MEEYNYLTITDAGWSPIEVDREGLGITDLEKRIEKLEEGFRKIELKNRVRNGEIYNLIRLLRSLWGRIKVEVGEQIKLEKQQRQIKLDKIREMVELGADRAQVTILFYSS